MNVALAHAHEYVLKQSCELWDVKCDLLYVPNKKYIFFSVFWHQLVHSYRVFLQVSTPVFYLLRSVYFTPFDCEI